MVTLVPKRITELKNSTTQINTKPNFAPCILRDPSAKATPSTDTSLRACVSMENTALLPMASRSYLWNSLNSIYLTTISTFIILRPFGAHIVRMITTPNSVSTHTTGKIIVGSPISSTIRHSFVRNGNTMDMSLPTTRDVRKTIFVRNPMAGKNRYTTQITSKPKDALQRTA